MQNQYGKEEDPAMYLEYMTSDIEDRMDKIRGWMRPVIVSYLVRQFPGMTDGQAVDIILSFTGSAEPIR